MGKILAFAELLSIFFEYKRHYFENKSKNFYVPLKIKFYISIYSLTSFKINILCDLQDYRGVKYSHNDKGSGHY